MLILRRKEGQWVEITHKSGDVIRVRVCNVRSRYPGQVDLALDDAAHNFIIQRPERTARLAAEAHAQAVAVVEPIPIAVMTETVVEHAPEPAA